MDLIYTNAKREDLGVLLDYEMDLAFGQDENNFECTIASASHCCEAGSYLYMEGTEYGGIVDSIQSRSADKEVIYSGRTWHGILGSKVILPLQAGETAPSGVTIKTTDSAGNSLVGRYLIISGDAHACMRFLISRIGLSDMYTAPAVSSGVNISQYQFNRYTDAYNGIVRMLASAGQKLRVTYTGGMVVLSAAEKHDYSQDEEFDSDLVEYDVKKSYNTVNHLICLGTGELENRMVVHLYADASGNISRTQTQFGMDEYTATYEYPNVESEEELIKNGTEELQYLWEPDKLSVDLDERMDDYDVGDTVGTMDVITGMRISATITKKIITIKNGQINVDISTDNYSTSGSGASGDGGVEEAKPLTLNDVYPVGSIYMSTNSTSPASLFGGTWEQIHGRFLLATGGTGANTDGYFGNITGGWNAGLGSMGGQDYHTLTVGEIPSHNHGLVRQQWYSNDTVASSASYSIFSWKSEEGGLTSASYYGYDDVKYTGGNTPHNNMPPYLAVSVWKRVS